MRPFRPFAAAVLVALAACRQAPEQRMEAARTDLRDAQENLSQALEEQAKSNTAVQQAEGELEAAHARMEARLKDVDAEIGDLESRATTDEQRQRLAAVRQESADVHQRLQRESSGAAPTSGTSEGATSEGTTSQGTTPEATTSGGFVDENHDGKDDRTGQTVIGQATEDLDAAMRKLADDVEQARKDVSGEK